MMEAMRLATKETDSTGKTYRHWTFVVCDGKILEWGSNNMDGVAPKHFGYSPFSKHHSEFVAYRKARGLLKGAKFAIINIRLNKQGLMKMSMPCEVCWEWLQAVGCTECWFSTENGMARL